MAPIAAVGAVRAARVAPRQRARAACVSVPAVGTASAT